MIWNYYFILWQDQIVLLQFVISPDPRQISPWWPWRQLRHRVRRYGCQHGDCSFLQAGLRREWFHGERVPVLELGQRSHHWENYHSPFGSYSCRVLGLSMRGELFNLWFNIAIYQKTIIIHTNIINEKVSVCRTFKSKPLNRFEWNLVHSLRNYHFLKRKKVERGGQGMKSCINVIQSHYPTRTRSQAQLVCIYVIICMLKVVFIVSIVISKRISIYWRGVVF